MLVLNSQQTVNLDEVKFSFITLLISLVFVLLRPILNHLYNESLRNCFHHDSRAICRSGGGNS